MQYYADLATLENWRTNTGITYREMFNRVIYIELFIISNWSYSEKS